MLCNQDYKTASMLRAFPCLCSPNSSDALYIQRNFRNSATECYGGTDVFYTEHTISLSVRGVCACVVSMVSDYVNACPL